MTLHRICAAALMATAFSAIPAAAATTHDEQVWMNATVIGVVPGSDVAYFAEVQPRFSDGAGRLGTLLLRPAVGWRFSPAFTGYAGYARVISPIENARDRTEDRLFLQASWTLGALAGGEFSTRTRLEHRRQDNGRDTGWRVRNMFRWEKPIGSPKRARALVWAEPFVALNDTDWGARGGFDQLRSFIGVEVPVGPRSTLELGYLNQAVNQPGGQRRMNHVASITAFIRP